MSTPELLGELSASIRHEPMLMTEAGIGGRAIDRCSPHLRDPLRAKSLNPVLSHRQPTKPATNFDKHSSKGKNKKKAQPETKPVKLLSPASSQRYLLGSQTNSEEFFEPAAPLSSVMVNERLRVQSSKMVEDAIFTRPREPLSRFQTVKVEEPSDARPSSSSSSSCSNSKEQQVVVLRVSLHCKGCEGKVRKHISKMEGVTSFTTDLVNKKVTVTGDVTPLGVLNSISKVKNAQIWPSQPRALA